MFVVFFPLSIVCWQWHILASWALCQTDWPYYNFCTVHVFHVTVRVVCVHVHNILIIKQMYMKSWCENPEKNTLLWRTDVRRMLKSTLWKYNGSLCTGFMWLKIGGGPITVSPLGLSTTLFLSVLNICVHSLIWQTKCHRCIEPSVILRHGRDGLLQVNLEG
jgi:hypothetical protein